MRLRAAPLAQMHLPRPLPSIAERPAANFLLGPHGLNIWAMKRGPKKRQCEDCKRKKKRCPPDHLLEELPGEESKDEEEGEAEWEEDPYAHIRRVDLPGELGAEIRDRSTGSRYKKKTMRAPPATSKKEQQLRVQLQQQQTQLQQIQSQVAGTSFCFPLLFFR